MQTKKKSVNMNKVASKVPQPPSAPPMQSNNFKPMPQQQVQIPPPQFQQQPFIQQQQQQQQLFVQQQPIPQPQGILSSVFSSARQLFGGSPAPPPPQAQRMRQQMPMQQFVTPNNINPHPFLDEEKQIYNDDDAIYEKVKSESKPGNIFIDIKAQRSVLRLKEAVKLPAMASIRSEGGTRSTVDLICVIDVSGSMEGSKIALVIDTLKFLIDTLTPADRLSVITFNDGGRRLCSLKCVNTPNKDLLTGIANSLRAGGGTNICSGLNLALKTFRERKFKNQVSSIFLLSDGQDKGALPVFQALTNEPRNKDIGIYSLQSFGFGNDHDEDLMSKLCELKDGAFFFIKELSTLDEAFCNALGGMISLVATDIELSVRNVSQGLLQNVAISKTFGLSWKKQDPKNYKVNILQLMSEITRDFVFELAVPSIDAQVLDHQRNQVILEGKVTAKDINGAPLSSECKLQILILNSTEEIMEINENADVLENYLRVQATQVIEMGMQLAESSKYDEAKSSLQGMIDSIKTNTKVRQEKMVGLVQDLEDVREKCAPKVYQDYGKKAMKCVQYSHQNQNNFQYMNSVQTQMVAQQKSKKMG